MKSKHLPHFPVWSASVIDADPLFFVQPEGAAAASARLLLVPEAMPRLVKATRDVAYVAGQDFTWEPGSREIVLTPRSAIPFRTHAQILLPPGSPDSIAASRDGKKHLLFGEGAFFHNQQVSASYEPAERWSGPVPEADAEALSLSLERLAAKEPFKIVVLGDSISTGANASGVVGAPPGQMGYPDLVADGLHARFGSVVELTNLSVGGMVAPWGVGQMQAAIAERPDLFIIAFGMNDASGKFSPGKYRKETARMAGVMRDACPDCDVICVATMTANETWQHAAPKLYPAYLEQLLTLRQPGVAVADVTSVWTWIVERKSALDLSGNGVNHPNDFGHRLYADVVLALFPGSA
jgi:lysophospholipase L1-like esterase